MTFSKSLTGFPVIYLEIGDSVASGKPFIQKYDTEAQAKAVRLSYYRFRSTLRKAVEKDPKNEVMARNLADADLVSVKVKEDGTVIYDSIENGWIAKSMREAHEKAKGLGLGD